jgi:hypothetical protein
VKSEICTCAATGLLYSGLLYSGVQPLNERQHVHMSYEQLPNENTIRLTEIEPSQDMTSTVECCLKVDSLASAPSYEALSVSYRWGKKGERFLRCGGKSLSIRPILEDVLKRLRNTQNQRVIWTDATCIIKKKPKREGWTAEAHARNLHQGVTGCDMAWERYKGESRASVRSN